MWQHIVPEDPTQRLGRNAYDQQKRGWELLPAKSLDLSLSLSLQIFLAEDYLLCATLHTRAVLSIEAVIKYSPHGDHARSYISLL